MKKKQNGEGGVNNTDFQHLLHHFLTCNFRARSVVSSLWLFFNVWKGGGGRLKCEEGMPTKLGEGVEVEVNIIFFWYVYLFYGYSQPTAPRNVLPPRNNDEGLTIIGFPLFFMGGYHYCRGELIEQSWFFVQYFCLVRFGSLAGQHGNFSTLCVVADICNFQMDWGHLGTRIKNGQNYLS